jgi:antitoxin (DNA-binding transcriptional repressor) of toxin-antitoxin stability system
MRTVTVRDLRNNFSRLEIWLGEGEEIQIEKHGQPIALLTGLPRRRRKPAPKPDFKARLKRLWGDRVFTAEEVRKMRAAELEGEEG